MNKIELGRVAMSMINELGAVCATEGISEENKEKANGMISDLLEHVRASVQQLSATSLGIVTN